MSMSGLTSNELLPIGKAIDIVSIYDINVVMEKIDVLLKNLFDSAQLQTSDISELDSAITKLKTDETRLTSDLYTAVNNIDNLDTRVTNANILIEQHEKDIEAINSTIMNAGGDPVKLLKTKRVSGKGIVGISSDSMREIDELLLLSNSTVFYADIPKQQVEVNGNTRNLFLIGIIPTTTQSGDWIEFKQTTPVASTVDHYTYKFIYHHDVPSVEKYYIYPSKMVFTLLLT